MPSFIKATEIWIPGSDRTQLVFGSGLYGGMQKFREISEQQEFAYGEGLPGRAWSEGRPQVLKGFDSKLFRRGEAAWEAGLTAAIALPIFVGEVLMAVVVFLCGDEGEHAGAVEVWAQNAREEMALVDGYYGSMDRFEWISRRISFTFGRGLPGSVWKSRAPAVIDDLSNSSTFLRARNAAEAGITTALGIPCFHADESLQVMAFLSARGTPIARRFEVWQPGEEARNLRFAGGYCETGTDLHVVYADLAFAKGDHLLGTTWLTGTPHLLERLEVEDSALADSARDAGLHSLLAIPLFDKGMLQSVVVFYI